MRAEITNVKSEANYLTIMYKQLRFLSSFFFNLMVQYRYSITVQYACAHVLLIYLFIHLALLFQSCNWHKHALTRCVCVCVSGLKTFFYNLSVFLPGPHSDVSDDINTSSVLSDLFRCRCCWSLIIFQWINWQATDDWNSHHIM